MESKALALETESKALALETESFDGVQSFSFGNGIL
jgi:hypothetical protein